MKLLKAAAAAAFTLATILTVSSLPTAAQASGATLRYGHVNSGSAEPLDEIGWGLHRGIIQEELKKIGITEITVAPGMVGPDLNDAINSGSLDLVTYGDGPAVVARAIGTPTRLIDFSSVTRQSIIVTRPDWPQDIKSLDGKKIAVVVGSTMHRQTEEFLKNNGVNATFVSGGNDLSLLQSGTVDAIAGWPYGAQLYLLIHEKGYKVIFDSADHPSYAWSLLSASSEDFLKLHPDLPRAWATARAKATEDLLANQDEFYAWFGSKSGVDAALAKALFPADQIARGTEEEFAQGTQLIETAKAILLKSGRIQEDFPVAEWVAR
ncbi:ABC transporter substrate-binding protein [Mesorhizobium sp. CAU 1732]|uniref:ABC transporter substrate-binding protein n=1 Tax=Mesorhizobium sp. CAU 1732 TaxID=3140358 RepID=UPI003261B3C6